MILAPGSRAGAQVMEKAVKGRSLWDDAVRRLFRNWAAVSGMAVLGLGYAPPYLDAMQDHAERSIAFMPGRLGVLAWPEGTLSAVGLVDPLELPLRDAVIDRLLVVHALEISEDANAMLEEL